MKVVLNNIKDLIDEAIKTHTAGKIARIELTSDEFEEFTRSAMFCKVRTLPPPLIKEQDSGTGGVSRYGLYTHYDGVCIQCTDIKKDKDIVVGKEETIHLEPWKKYDEFGRCN